MANSFLSCFNKSKYRIWLIGLLILIVWLLTSFLVYHIWIHGADHRDFYPLWKGSRLVLLEHQDLYSPKTTRRLQIELYGQAFSLERDQQGFAYPATSLIVFLPFVLIKNVEIATAAWVGISVILTFLTLISQRKEFSEQFDFLIVMFLMIWYFPLLNFFQGQTMAVMLASLGMSYWAYSRGYFSVAGALLAIGLIKPGIVLLPVLTILVLAFRNADYKVIWSFVGANLLIVLLSFVFAGYWIPGWIQALQRYSEYAKVFWPLGISWNVSPVLVVIFLLVIGYVLYLLRDHETSLFAVSIPVGMLMFPQTLIWGLTILLIPFSLLWYGINRYLIAAIWILGWMSIVGNIYLQDWWKVQNIAFPVFTILLVCCSYYLEEKNKMHSFI